MIILEITVHNSPELCNVKQMAAQFKTQMKLDLSFAQYNQYDEQFKPKDKSKTSSNQRQIYGHELPAYEHELAHDYDFAEFSTEQSFDINSDIDLIKAFNTEAKVSRNESHSCLSNEQWENSQPKNSPHEASFPVRADTSSKISKNMPTS